MTHPDIDRAWAAYVAAERDRIRDVSMARLRQLIGALEALPEADRHAWSRRLARESVDEGLATPVRFPLFREVLFPALLVGLRSEEPGCARWLAGLSQLLYQSPECLRQLAPHERTEIGLLRAALRVDPNDELARAKLIQSIKWQLEYSLHELPSGVLFGNDGATIDQCRELQAELDEFENLVQTHGSRADHADLIAECRHHYHAYPDYLAKRSRFRSYADYLANTSTA